MTTLQWRVAISSVVAFLIAWPNLGEAAEIISGPKLQGCDWTLKGPIKRGDSDFLKSGRLVRNGRRGWGTLCLDSEGGLVSEAFQAIELIQEYRLRTKVPEGARCFSACAFMFMAGLSQTDEGVRARRTLHVRGQLGFHAPYIIPSKRSFSRSEVTRVFEFAVANVTRLIELSARKDDSNRDEFALIPRFALVNALRMPPQELFFIDTVGKALLSGISLDGIERTTPVDAEYASNLCANQWLLKHSEKGPISKGVTRKKSWRTAIPAPPSPKPVTTRRWLGS